MIILGIDVGYSNLGLAVIDSEKAEILWSETITVGSQSRPEVWGERLWGKFELFLPFELEGIAIETPPFLVPKPKAKKAEWVRKLHTSALLSRVGGNIQAWAACHNIPYAEVAPLVLKRHCSKVLGKPYSRLKPPTKAEIKEAVIQEYGKRAGDNHANDGALLAHYYAKTHEPSRP